MNRHHDDYDKKFVEHGLRVLHKEQFNQAVNTKTTHLEPCHAWILSPKPEEEAEADAEDTHGESDCSSVFL